MTGFRQDKELFDDVVCTAAISTCERYRYHLSRQWGVVDDKKLLFIMFNPSTADAFKGDPTITRCIGFAKREGYGGISVVNLYAFRTSKPKELRFAQSGGMNVVGPLTDEFLLRAAHGHGHGVCAWGANTQAKDMGRVADVVRLLKRGHCRLHQLGDDTKQGNPRHPLMLRADTPLQRFQG